MRTDGLQPLRLRDRDAIITEEGIIFRVYGYSHPPNAYVCDPEYAPAEIFKSKNPKALRARGKQVYYKFYFDEGLRFVHTEYPKYRIFYHPLQKKLVYALFKDGRSGRTIKTEFEPVKDWNEIRNEYSSKAQILRKGWIKAVVRIIDDKDGAFMPSIYLIEPVRILRGERVDDIRRIISYIEEFRMQVRRGEEAYVEGNLERVTTPSKTFHQITLTYASRYFEQVLKVAKSSM
jgi:predicted nucleotidyltransferase